jgi:hypothetical protein
MTMMFVIVTQAFLWAGNAALLLLAPELILGWFKIVQAPSVDAFARVFGSELAGLALASYFTRQIIYTQYRKPVALAYIASNALGFLVTAGAMVQGALGGLTWALSALYLIYAVAFAYYFFFDKKAG